MREISIMSKQKRFLIRLSAATVVPLFDIYRELDYIRLAINQDEYTALVFLLVRCLLYVLFSLMSSWVLSKKTSDAKAVFVNALTAPIIVTNLIMLAQNSALENKNEVIHQKYQNVIKGVIENKPPTDDNKDKEETLINQF